MELFDPATDNPENRRPTMGKVKEYAQDWLERGGTELGYDMGNLPTLQDFDGVLLNNMSVEEYFDKPEQKGPENNDNTSTRDREPTTPG
jgi:hypothetical protein